MNQADIEEEQGERKFEVEHKDKYLLENGVPINHSISSPMPENGIMPDATEIIP